MKPLRLTMKAFGPYARQATVDFRVVSNGGLFLIHGQTGAGKTSILDGLCFALFGRASGAERTPDGLRSDHATPDVATEVILEFALGKDVYRIVRRPRQTIRKQRGEGLKTDQPRGDLWKLDQGDACDLSFDFDSASWSLIASGDRKTDEQIGVLLGMTEEQFRQVVVLPQGQFRKFLSASSDAREELLEKLFRSSRFRRLTDSLDQQSKKLAGEITLARQSLSAHLTSFEVTTIDDLQVKIVSTESRLSELERDAEPLEARHRRASERRDRALSAAKVNSDFVATLTKKDTLLSRKSDYEVALKKLQDEKRARPVLVVDSKVATIDSDCTSLDRDLSREREKLKERESRLSSLRQLHAKLTEQQPSIDAKRNEVEELRVVFTNAKALKEAIDSERSSKARLQSALVELEKAEHAFSKLKQKREESDALILQNESAAAMLDGLIAQRELQQKELDSVKDVVQLFAEVGRLTNERLAAEKLHQNATNALENSRVRLKKGQLAFHLSQASRLSEELKDNEPCPVCGSLDHPMPARPSGSAPDPEDLEHLEEDLRLKTEAQSKQSLWLAKIEADFVRSKSEYDRRALALMGSAEIDPAEFKTVIQNRESELRKKEAEIAQSRRAASTAKETRTARVQIEADLQKIEAVVQEALRTRDAAQTLVAQSGSRIQTLEEQVPPESRNLDSITQRGQKLREVIAEFQTALQDVSGKLEMALQDESGSRASIDTTERQLLMKIAQRETLIEERERLRQESKFETLDDCRAAKLDPVVANELDRRRSEFERESHSASERLRELEIEIALIPDWAMDLASRELEFLAIDTERTDRKAERLSLSHLVATLKASKEKLDSAIQSITTLEQRYAVVGRLAEVASGRPPNLTRVNFQRYVLASQLDEVLEQASRRLYEMSRGQFTLRRSRQVDDKRKSAGLDLEVEDAFTGTSRPTASLSGGEGFLASLSLALGLADVVQSHLGGVRLDAVFVDEGFGTLDTEALELAMKTLAELRAGGRLVGIISHVPELRDQIAHRLVVRKSPEGSEVGWDSTAG